VQQNYQKKKTEVIIKRRIDSMAITDLYGYHWHSTSVQPTSNK